MFVPVNIGYEKLIEASSYLDELRGGAKERESILDVLRSLRLIRNRYSAAFTSASATALPLDDFLANTDATGPQMARELGIELLDRINACANVNPINLIALVTLSTPKQIDRRVAADRATRLPRGSVAREHAVLRHLGHGHVWRGR